MVASVPAREAATSTVVLVAHHDAANTGLLWRSPFADSGAKPEGRPPMTLLTELAMAAHGHGPPPPAAAGARAAGDGGGPVAGRVPRRNRPRGASDNATGVAAVLELARRLVAEPLAHTEVRLVLDGLRGVGHGRHGRLDARTRAGGWRRVPRWSSAWTRWARASPWCAAPRVRLWRVAYRAEDLVLADKGAEAVGESAPRRFRIGGYTDPALARLAGLPTISLLSLRGNVFNDYHLPSDTPEHVDWDGVDRAREDRRGHRAVPWARGR